MRETPTVSLDEVKEIAATAGEGGVPPSAADILFRLLRELPPRDRLVLTLRYIEECSLKETAERTGWTETMVKVQSWRAKKKLKSLFSEMGFEVAP
jgi:DNA-directed RNA polymerase specialized sigma24 family protein